MKRLIGILRHWLTKPQVRYLILFAVLGGGLWFMHDAPCDVSVSVDLERVHRLGDGVLSRMEVKVQDSESAWISTSTFNYPAALHPDGPGPIRTDAKSIQLQLPPGTYLVSMTMYYRRTGASKAPSELRKEFEITVDRRETLEVLRP